MKSLVCQIRAVRDYAYQHQDRYSIAELDELVTEFNEARERLLLEMRRRRADASDCGGRA